MFFDIACMLMHTDGHWLPVHLYMCVCSLCIFGNELINCENQSLTNVQLLVVVTFDPAVLQCCWLGAVFFSLTKTKTSSTKIN